MLIPDGFAQANFHFNGPPCPSGAQMTLGVNVSQSTLTPDEMCEQLYLAAENFMTGSISSTCNLEKVTIKLGPNATGPMGEFVGEGSAGTGSVSVAPNTAILISKQTLVGGRQGRGRLYMPGLSEGSVDESGYLLPTTITGLQGGWELFYAELIADDLDPVLLHAEGSPNTEPNLITAFVVQSRVASQRRRNRR